MTMFLTVVAIVTGVFVAGFLVLLALVWVTSHTTLLWPSPTGDARKHHLNVALRVAKAQLGLTDSLGDTVSDVVRNTSHVQLAIAHYAHAHHVRLWVSSEDVVSLFYEDLTRPDPPTLLDGIAGMTGQKAPVRRRVAPLPKGDAS